VGALFLLSLRRGIQLSLAYPWLLLSLPPWATMAWSPASSKAFQFDIHEAGFSIYNFWG
jgi:hypothetical protein